MERLTKRHGKHAVQIGAETRRNDPGWDRLAILEDLEEQKCDGEDYMAPPDHCCDMWRKQEVSDE